MKPDSARRVALCSRATGEVSKWTGGASGVGAGASKTSRRFCRKLGGVLNPSSGPLTGAGRNNDTDEGRYLLMTPSSCLSASFSRVVFRLSANFWVLSGCSEASTVGRGDSTDRIKLVWRSDSGEAFLLFRRARRNFGELVSSSDVWSPGEVVTRGKGFARLEGPASFVGLGSRREGVVLSSGGSVVSLTEFVPGSLSFWIALGSATLGVALWIAALGALRVATLGALRVAALGALRGAALVALRGATLAPGSVRRSVATVFVLGNSIAPAFGPLDNGANSGPSHMYIFRSRAVTLFAISVGIFRGSMCE